MLLETAARIFNDSHRLTYAHIGPDLIIVEGSENFSFLLPDGMETAEGRPLSEVIEAFVGAESHLQAVLNKEQTAYTLKYVKRKQPDGNNLYFNFQVVNLDTINGVAGLLLIIEDVTNTAKMGQQLVYYHTTLNQTQEQLFTAETELEQLNQFKSFLISMLAHDMRTPLAAIRGYAELLLRLLNSEQAAANPAKAKSFADNICYITDQMTWLINDIIDLDQAEKGLLTTSLESCDLHQVIQETIAMFDSIIKLQNLTLILELNLPDLLVAANSQRVRQIVNNLIGNAIKYSPNGGEISISTYAEAENAVLVVLDNGKGMTAEETKKIFQPYYRTNGAKSSNILGSGLGLHIVKILVEVQNGRIDVASELGKGSTYTVRLPLM
jgi:signal transduction histidine kinase